MVQARITPLRVVATAAVVGIALLGCRSARQESSCQTCGTAGAPMNGVVAAVVSDPAPAAAVSNERYVANPAPTKEPESLVAPQPQPQPLPNRIVTSERPALPLKLPPTLATEPAVTFPNGITSTRTTIQSPAEVTKVPATQPNYHHAPDYSTLTGELSYVAHKNQWRLRFAAIDVEDRYGGSVTLDSAQQLRGYQNGQFVQVTGEVVDPESRDIAPMYRVRNITLLSK